MKKYLWLLVAANSSWGQLVVFSVNKNYGLFPMVTKGKEVKERRMDNGYKFDSLLKVETLSGGWMKKCL